MSLAAVPEPHTVKVVRTWDETPSLRGISLATSDVLLDAHTAPGQFLKVTVSEGTGGFFALANAPGTPFELLVKKSGSVGESLSALPVGAELAITPPQGPGYLTAHHEGRDLLLFAAGSGIAPIAAVLKHIASKRDRFGAVRLYDGQRESTHFAFGAEPWVGNVQALRVLSRAEPGWSGLSGHVQDALRADPPKVDNAVAYLCGMKGMVEAVTSSLVELGLPRDRIFLNY